VIGAGTPKRGERQKGGRRIAAALAIAALGSGLAASVPAKADEAMIEGCLKAAADVHHVPAGVLVLLLSVEGGRLGAVSRNTNGTVDIGPMQVNDTWLGKIAAHWGASREAAYRALRDNFCANVEGAPGFCARRSTRRMATFGRASRSITRMTPFISSNTCASSTSRRCASSARPGGRGSARWLAPTPGLGGRMARSPRGVGPVSSDDFTGFTLILIVVGVGILGWASWHVWHAEISRIALLLAHWEMQAIGLVTDRFRLADLEVQRAHLDRVQFGQLVRLYRNIGREFVYPAMALVLALAGLCFLRAGNARFTRTFDLEKLMAEQAIHSRSTAAFVSRGLKLSKLRAGEPRPADAALHVDEWVARYATSEKSGFDETAARREFMRQLGGRWMGPAAASPAVRSMLAVFALQGVQRRDEAAALLGLLSEGLPRGKADGVAGPEEPLAFDPKTLRLADRVLATVDVAGWAFDVIQKHHFTTPGLMSVLNQARLRSGVLAPAQFAFLKLVDRRLWYALHAVGFESDTLVAHPHPSMRVEAIGAGAHWAAERAAGVPIPAPEFDSAIAAIRPKGAG